VVVIKYNSTYDYNWNFTFGSSNFETSYEIAIDQNDNIYIAGTTWGFGAGGNDAFIANFGIDEDNDGLTHDQEIDIYGTNPNDADHDDDGLADGVEVNTYGTNPLNPDTDGDGLTDGVEVNTYGTNPSNADTDGDGYSDGDEISEGTDPNDPNSYPMIIPGFEFIIIIGIVGVIIVFKLSLKRLKNGNIKI